MSSFRIRPVILTDRAEVLKLNQQGFPGVSLMSDTEFSTILACSPYFKIVEFSGEIVAYLIAFLENSLYAGEEFLYFKKQFVSFLYVDQIVVSASQKKSGIGSRFYQDLEAFARQEKRNLLCLEVNEFPPNPVSYQFHQKQGFQEKTKLSTQDGRTVILMCKKLSETLAI